MLPWYGICCFFVPLVGGRAARAPSLETVCVKSFYDRTGQQRPRFIDDAPNAVLYNIQGSFILHILPITISLTKIDLRKCAAFQNVGFHLFIFDLFLVASSVGLQTPEERPTDRTTAWLGRSVGSLAVAGHGTSPDRTESS